MVLCIEVKTSLCEKIPAGPAYMKTYKKENVKS